MLTFAQPTRAENINTAMNNCVKTPFFITRPPRGASAVIATPAVSGQRRTGVHDLRGHAKERLWLVYYFIHSYRAALVRSQSHAIFFSKAIDDKARGFICREKSFNTEFLQTNIQRR